MKASLLLCRVDVEDRLSIPALLKHLKAVDVPTIPDRVAMVVHAAGIEAPHDVFFAKAIGLRVFRPKAHGLCTLHNISTTVPALGFVVFSSISAVLGI